MLVDDRAVISSSATIGHNVKIGAYATIGDNAVIGDDCVIAANATIGSNTRLGKNNNVYAYAVVGNDPQDITPPSESSQCIVGDNNIFREFVTVSRGTPKQDNVTRIGNNNFFMTKSHVGHDCTIADDVILVNDATLAGHVTIDNRATIGSFSQVHQFTYIGAYSFTAHFSLISKDVLPYLMITGPDPIIHGLNKIGLKRQGYSTQTIRNLEKAFRIIFKNNLLLAEAQVALNDMLLECPEVDLFIKAIARSKRGFLR